MAHAAMANISATCLGMGEWLDISWPVRLTAPARSAQPMPCQRSPYLALHMPSAS
eukprot:CAMPEP_0183541880 /NCGR_PEP_ID=MMETSP0371-20130417/40815_1 /TAXON_ID=268820 /ORGANISM="Peridinium aciculiferum, Strain PAER-2" /LENGTH=54 /DNA_ID=CAMNT_0025743041 /DNA_START=21 /DNA_END=182 /DNA_ORIENTATION=-